MGIEGGFRRLITGAVCVWGGAGQALAVLLVKATLLGTFPLCLLIPGRRAGRNERTTSTFAEAAYAGAVGHPGQQKNRGGMG